MRATRPALPHSIPVEKIMRVSPPAFRSALAVAFVLSLAVVTLARAEDAAAPIVGFRAADVAAERAHEAMVSAVPRPDSLRKHLRLLTEVPHVAGTPADRATAEYVQQRLTAYGWDARIEAVPVWLNYPKEMHVELVEPNREPLAVRERGAAWDKDAYDSDAFDAFHGYSASGDVTAPVVYANYGDVDDLKALAGLGIDVRGKIVLVRYGKIFRGLKVRNAERAGAAGVIIYSDPLDDGYAKADAYPRGAARPEDAIQRGSVQFLSEGPGDPTTPGWASTANGKRLKPAEAHGVPRIPSIPLAWAEAQKILDALEGPNVPTGWQGGLPLAYHVGPGPAKIHLVSQQDYAVRPIWNVIATMKGREAPDEWIVCGNHRDAWVFGAVDPNSGTICLLEMARGLGELAKTGWRPRRTIMLCSWDGEEYGLLGSTEWTEANAEAVSKKVVAYLNIDTAVGGKDFRVGGSHALRDVLVGALKDVPDPGKSGTVFQSWTDKGVSDGKTEWARLNRERRWRGEPTRPLEMNVSPLGSGSDYTSFLDHLGVPSMDLRFEGLQGTYHSMYDDFEYMDRIVDPGYPYHVAVTGLWSRVTMRLADAELAPLRYSNTGQFAIDELQSIEDRMDDANAAVTDSAKLLRADFTAVRAAATRLRDAGRAFEQRADAALAGSAWPGGSVAATNAALIGAERALLGAGLPGRTWFRHELYAPGLNTGYAPVPLPRLGQAVLDKEPAALRAGTDPIRAALDRAATVLERAR
jgi:N-acetylated-alpha-linked acidic dipeptidase